MGQTEPDISRMQKEAWQEGYDAALEKIRYAIKMRQMGMADCEIVRRTELPPALVHAILGEK